MIAINGEVVTIHNSTMMPKIHQDRMFISGCKLYRTRKGQELNHQKAMFYNIAGEMAKNVQMDIFWNI